MSQGELSEVRSRMAGALVLLREAVDLSLPLLDSEQKGQVVALWEDFLREFFRHVKKKGRESRLNLFSCLSFRRIWAR